MTDAPATGPGIYVHVPWCRRRCPYCDFSIVVGRAQDARFNDAVVEELAARRSELGGEQAATLYFGGGTPSSLAPGTLASLVTRIRAGADLAPDAEITIEANPEDIDEDAVTAWREAGINRVSLGVQSFDEDQLRYLGRVHDAAMAARALALATKIGRVSVDIIAGTPDGSLDALRRDLDAALAGGAGHLSVYLLTIEAGTPLQKLIARGKRGATDDEAQADAYRFVQAHLEAAGLGQYEVSSYARPGESSRHNRIYWRGVPYLGLGPGAHSLRTDAGHSVRAHNDAPFDLWANAPGKAGHVVERLDQAASFREAVAFALRDMEGGFDARALANRHQVSLPADIERTMRRAEDAGWATEPSAGRWTLSPAGALFADAIARDLLVP